MKTLTYSDKLKIADEYLVKLIGFGWDDLADINSLHDCETHEDIIAYCEDRLEEAGMPRDWMDN